MAMETTITFWPETNRLRTLHVSFKLKVPITPKSVFRRKNLCVFVSKMVKTLWFLLENSIFYVPSKSQKITKNISTTELVRGLGLFLGWCHRFIYIALTLYKHACKTVCDVNPGIDPDPSQARSCEFFRWFSATLTAHKMSSFQAKTIIFSPFYSQKHKDFFKRKTILGYRHFNCYSCWFQLLSLFSCDFSCMQSNV